MKQIRTSERKNKRGTAGARGRMVMEPLERRVLLALASAAGPVAMDELHRALNPHAAPPLAKTGLGGVRQWSASLSAAAAALHAADDAAPGVRPQAEDLAPAAVVTPTAGAARHVVGSSATAIDPGLTVSYAAGAGPFNTAAVKIASRLQARRGRAGPAAPARPAAPPRSTPPPARSRSPAPARCRPPPPNRCCAP